MKKLLFLVVITAFLNTGLSTFAMSDFLTNKITNLLEGPKELAKIRTLLATMLEIGNYPEDHANEAYAEFVLCQNALNEVPLSVLIEIVEKYEWLLDHLILCEIIYPNRFANNDTDIVQSVDRLFNETRNAIRNLLLDHTNVHYDSKVLRRAPGNLSLKNRLKSLRSTVQGAQQVIRKVRTIKNISYYATVGAVTIVTGYLFKKYIYTPFVNYRKEAILRDEQQRFVFNAKLKEIKDSIRLESSVCNEIDPKFNDQLCTTTCNTLAEKIRDFRSNREIYDSCAYDLDRLVNNPNFPHILRLLLKNRGMVKNNN